MIYSVSLAKEQLVFDNAFGKSQEELAIEELGSKLGQQISKDIPLSSRKETAGFPFPTIEYTIEAAVLPLPIWEELKKMITKSENLNEQRSAILKLIQEMDQLRPSAND